MDIAPRKVDTTLLWSVLAAVIVHVFLALLLWMKESPQVKKTVRMQIVGVSSAPPMVEESHSDVTSSGREPALKTPAGAKGMSADLETAVRDPSQKASDSHQPDTGINRQPWLGDYLKGNRKLPDVVHEGYSEMPPRIVNRSANVSVNNSVLPKGTMFQSGNSLYYNVDEKCFVERNMVDEQGLTSIRYPTKCGSGAELESNFRAAVKMRLSH